MGPIDTAHSKHSRLDTKGPSIVENILIGAALRTTIGRKELERLMLICSQTREGGIDRLMAGGPFGQLNRCETAVHFVRRCKKQRRLGCGVSDGLEHMQRSHQVCGEVR